MTASPPQPREQGGELDELTLIRAQRGEDAACRAFVERYQRPVFALLGRMLGPAGQGTLVEDLAQETFLRAFRALPAFDRGGPARLSSWLLTIATRLALDELRKRGSLAVPGRQTVSLDDPEAHGAASGDRADDVAERRTLAKALQHAVTALAPEYRAAFLLRELHDQSYEEIARALGVDVGTVKSRLFRARAALRAALAEVHDG